MNELNYTTEANGAFYKPGRYFEIDTPFIPADQWPFALIEMAMSRGIEEHKLLRGTGIFREDIAEKYRPLAPQQCFQLILNMQKHIHSHELSFLSGHRIFTALNTTASNRFHDELNSAANLQQAIDVLLDRQIHLMPLLNVRAVYEQDRLIIYWQDACGAGATLIFLLEMMFTALNSLSRWRSENNIPWQFYFTHNKPGYIEQYDVHLNSTVQFSSQVNAMAIARDYLHCPWKENVVDRRLPDDGLTRQTSQPLALQRGFLAETYTYLRNNIQHNPGLEQTAADFGMSSASFKRKLKKHHSHFQEQYDLVRKDLALYWLNEAGWSKKQIARKLHFYDVANLRRAFKKWTGDLPNGR